jgi:hypothetical protein
MECHYELAAYGIPRKILPFDDDGNFLLTGFQETMEKRKKSELEKNFTASIVNPTELDVILGRGRPFQEFPGNLRWAEIIDEKLGRYQDMKIGEKWLISDEVIRRIRYMGGRFLKRTKDQEGWVIVSDILAREKTSQGFRTHIRRCQG